MNNKKNQEKKEDAKCAPTKQCSTQKSSCEPVKKETKK